MTTSRTFTVKPPPEVVVPYLADFAHAEEWDPGTVSCTRTSGKVVLVGENQQATSTDMVTVLDRLA